MLTKKDIVAPEYVRNYISLTKDEDMNKAILKNSRSFAKFLDKIPHKKIDFAYEEGKWTIRDILQHVIDTERVFSYRGLSFSRNDKNPLPGFEQADWAANAGTASRKWKELCREFNWLRASNELLFASFDDEQLLRKGLASNNELNVLAIGFNLAGHVEHHIKIIKEKYL